MYLHICLSNYLCVFTFISISVYLSTPYISLWMCIAVYLSIFISIELFVSTCISVCVYICTSIYSVCLFMNASVYLYIYSYLTIVMYQLVHLSFYLSFHPPLWLPLLESQTAGRRQLPGASPRTAPEGTIPLTLTFRRKITKEVKPGIGFSYQAISFISCQMPDAESHSAREGTSWIPSLMASRNCKTNSLRFTWVTLPWGEATAQNVILLGSAWC